MLIEQGSILGLLEEDEIGETVSKIQRYPDDAVVDEDLNPIRYTVEKQMHTGCLRSATQFSIARFYKVLFQKSKSHR